jgi:hypothetical protein
MSSNSFSICSSLDLEGQVSHPYTTTRQNYSFVYFNVYVFRQRRNRTIMLVVSERDLLELPHVTNRSWVLQWILNKRSGRAVNLYSKNLISTLELPARTKKTHTRTWPQLLESLTCSNNWRSPVFTKPSKYFRLPKQGDYPQLDCGYCDKWKYSTSEQRTHKQNSSPGKKLATFQY